LGAAEFKFEVLNVETFQSFEDTCFLTLSYLNTKWDRLDFHPKHMYSKCVIYDNISYIQLLGVYSVFRRKLVDRTCAMHVFMIGGIFLRYVELSILHLGYVCVGGSNYVDTWPCLAMHHMEVSHYYFYTPIFELLIN